MKMNRLLYSKGKNNNQEYKLQFVEKQDKCIK